MTVRRDPDNIVRLQRGGKPIESMTQDLFGASQSEGGAHHWLASLVGDWEGTTRTWFEPGKLGDESPTRGTMRAVLGGRFVVHEYDGTLLGEPLHGMTLYGCHLESGRWQSAWIDDRHMGTGIMFSEGARTEEGFSVLGQYDDPSQTLPWGWRTEIVILDANHVVITAYNISPQGEEAKAVETTYARKALSSSRA